MVKQKKYIFQEVTGEVYAQTKGDVYLYLGNFAFFGIQGGDSKQKRIGRVNSQKGIPRFNFTFSRNEMERMGQGS